MWYRQPVTWHHHPSEYCRPTDNDHNINDTSDFINRKPGHRPGFMQMTCQRPELGETTFPCGEKLKGMKQVDLVIKSRQGKNRKTHDESRYRNAHSLLRCTNAVNKISRW